MFPNKPMHIFILKINRPYSGILSMEKGTKIANSSLSWPSYIDFSIIPLTHWYIWTPIYLNMVTVLKFWTLFSVYSQIECGYQGWSSQYAWHNSKQGRPWSDCFWRSSLIWVCPVCLSLFGRQLHVVFKILEHLPQPTKIRMQTLYHTGSYIILLTIFKLISTLCP